MMRLTENIPTIVIQDGSSKLVWSAWYRGVGYYVRSAEHAVELIRKKEKEDGRQYVNAGVIWAMPKQFYRAYERGPAYDYYCELLEKDSDDSSGA